MCGSTIEVRHGAAGLTSSRLCARDAIEFRRVDGGDKVLDRSWADMYGCAAGTYNSLCPTFPQPRIPRRAGTTFTKSHRLTPTLPSQEFILLSDILGLSLLVDSIDHPKPPASTEGTVLGPFHTHDASYLPPGSNISADPSGTPLLVLCTLKTTSGTPIPNAAIDVWETDSHGKYDVQYSDRGDKADGRAVVKSNEEGVFWFKGIVPVPYPIPDDGPVGKLLERLGRHCWRPSHMHFMFEKEGFDRLVTYVVPFIFFLCRVLLVLWEC